MNWRDWITDPPTIPWAPIFITRSWMRYDDCENLIRKIDLWPESNVANLLWRPSGIYREEFYSVTGRWI